LLPQDFVEYEVDNRPMGLTFCLKEMKAILNFCESSGQHVNLFFEKPGKPILLVLEYFNVIEADFVLATLIDSEDPDGSSQSSSESISNPNGRSSAMQSTPSSSYQSSISPTTGTPLSMDYKLEPVDSSSPYKLGNLHTSTPDSDLPTIGDFRSDLDDISGHVSGSDDESVPQNKISISQKRRKRPVFTTDFQMMHDLSDNEDPDAMSDH
jgi:hypothetical protein